MTDKELELTEMLIRLGQIVYVEGVWLAHYSKREGGTRLEYVNLPQAEWYFKWIKEQLDEFYSLGLV